MSDEIEALKAEIADLKARTRNLAEALLSEVEQKRMLRSWGEDPKTLYCSFCNKSQHQVRKLIAGPASLICDECVGLCVEIVNNPKAEVSKP